MIDVFFYGLFMDRSLVEAKGLSPANVRVASVNGYALRIGARASLIPDRAGTVHGVLMSLTHGELDQLYSEKSVRDYRPEAVIATCPNGEIVAALCYNLPESPDADEPDSEYAAQLRTVAERLGLPIEYVASIR